MSASREKKQRQSSGPSEKALRAQQEQAARKRKTIIYSVIGAVVAVLVAALLVWRSGFFQARATAATLGGETITTAELSYYYHSARNSIAAYGSYLGFDTTKSDEDQLYNAADNVTYRDYFLESALNAAQEHLTLAREAEKAGHTEAEVKENLDANIAARKSEAASYGMSYAAYLKNLYGTYMTPAVYEKLTTRYLMANLVSVEKYSELFDGYSQDELDSYYQENADTLDTFEYSCLYFPVATVDTKDADGNALPDEDVQKLKDEAKEAAKKNAEEALEAVKDGASFQSQVEKYELSTSTSANNVDHAKVVGSASISSSYREQLLALAENQPELVESDNGYYVIAYHGRSLSEDLTRDVRHILVRPETETHTDENGSSHEEAPTDEAWAAAKEKIDAIKAEYDAGEKTEDAFAELAKKHSADSSASNGGLYDRSPDGYFVPEFNSWVFDASRQPGDVGIVQHAKEEDATSGYYGYHLLYYVGENEPVWMGSARDALADAAHDQWSEGLRESYPITQGSGVNYLGK